MSISSIESGLGDGYQAKVDSTNRLFTRAALEYSSGAVYTTLTTASTGTNTTISARTGRTGVVLQNLASVPVSVRFASAHAGAPDFRIAAGASFTFPFPYEGQIRVYGIGGGGDLVVIEAAIEESAE